MVYTQFTDLVSELCYKESIVLFEIITIFQFYIELRRIKPFLINSTIQLVPSDPEHPLSQTVTSISSFLFSWFLVFITKFRFHCFLSPFFCGWESTNMIFDECSKSDSARESKDFQFVPKATQKIQFFSKAT